MASICFEIHSIVVISYMSYVSIDLLVGFDQYCSIYTSLFLNKIIAATHTLTHFKNTQETQGIKNV